MQQIVSSFKPLFLAATLCLGLALHSVSAASEEDLNAFAESLLQNYIDAIIGGRDTLAEVLAPEYQLMRASGEGFTRDEYLSREIGNVKIEADFTFHDIVATRNGDILVARYMLHINETIDGQPATKVAPRITVFRDFDGQWKVVAHANFAAPH